MDEQTFKLRTKSFALDAMELMDKLRGSRATEMIAAQFMRSSTSVGANYRAACRAKSAADMINKLKIVEAECDESLYWLELLTESGALAAHVAEPLQKEGGEILAMTVASMRTLRARVTKSSIANRKS